MMNFSLHDWLLLLRELYNTYGYSIVFLSALLENTIVTGIFLPGNSLVLLGAFYARQGTLNLGGVILLATLGTIIGYHLDYLMGRFLLGSFLARWGKTPLARRLRLEARVRLARRLLHRHGGKTILLSHLISHLRSAVAIGAGFTHMPYRTFLAYEILAATIWNTLYGLLGYFIAVEIDQLGSILQSVGWIIALVLLVLYILWRLLRPYKKRRQKRVRPALQAKTGSLLVR